MNLEALKIGVLSSITGILSFLSFYFLNQFIILGNISSAWSIIISFLLFFIFIIFEVVFIRNIYFLTLLIFIQSILPLFSFVRSFNDFNLFLVVFAMLFLFSFWGVKKGDSVIKNGLKINFFSAAHRALPKVVTGILLFTVIILYFNYFMLGKFDEDMGRKIFNKTANSFTPVLKIWAPQTDLDMQVGKIIDKAAITELQSSKIELLKEKGINLDEISKQRKQELINQASLQIEKQLEETVGEINSEQTLREAAYTSIKRKVENMPPAFQKISGGAALLLLFFIVKGIALIIYPIIEFLAFLVYEILLMTGFARIGLETKKREIINLS